MELLGAFVALDVAVFEKTEAGSFLAAAVLPEWCGAFGVSGGETIDAAALAGRFPYLETFLEDAGEVWKRRSGVLRSEAWTQRDFGGRERSLSANAVCAGERNCLLLAMMGSQMEEQRAVLQLVRDRGLALDRMEKHTRQVEQARRETERVNRLKSEFLASMSHELRTPLHTIMGFSDLLIEGRGGDLTARQSEFVSHVKAAADHLLSLINDVLDLAKIEAGRVELKPEWFPLGEALNEVLPGLRAAAAQRGLRFEERGGECKVFADRLRFKQIIYNLASNAVKFTPAGTVRITASAGGGELQLAVEDTGLGIAPEVQEAIFDKFYQVGAASPVHEGTGLGLAIARRLVEQHGGSISVKSAPGKGSEFRISLPLPPEDGPDNLAESGAMACPSAAEPERAIKLKAAVVEDNASSRRLLEIMLAASFDVTSYADGASALREIPGLAPSIVLLDISLPDMNGADLLKALRARRGLKRTPIVAISAHAMSGDREIFLQAGFDAYYAKPIADTAGFQTSLRQLAEKAKVQRRKAKPDRPDTIRA